jgi:hypothetical protein
MGDENSSLFVARSEEIPTAVAVRTAAQSGWTEDTLTVFWERLRWILSV